LNNKNVAPYIAQASNLVGQRSHEYGAVVLTALDLPSILAVDHEPRFKPPHGR
jgi:hypothetical protein